MIGDYNDETIFPDKLLLTHTNVSRLCKAFANNSWANIKLSKNQLSKMVNRVLPSVFSCLANSGKIAKKLINTKREK